MLRYKVAAYLSIATGTLGIPILILEIGAVFLEVLTDSYAPGALLNLYYILLGLLSLPVYMILAKYLKQHKLAWPVYLLVISVVSGILFSMIPVLLPKFTLTISVLEIADSLFFAGVLLLFSILLIVRRKIFKQLDTFYSFAVCNLFTAVFILSIFLSPLASVTSVIANFLLAGVFFRIAKGTVQGVVAKSDEIKQDQDVRRADFYINLLLTCGLLFGGIIYFLKLYNSSALVQELRTWAHDIYLVLSAVYVLYFSVIFKRVTGQNAIVKASFWWMLVIVILLLHTHTQGMFVDKQDGLMTTIFYEYILAYGIKWLLSIASGGVLFYIYLLVARQEDKLNGYKLPIQLAFLTMALGYMLIVPDTLVLLGTFVLTLSTTAWMSSMVLTNNITSKLILSGKVPAAYTGLVLVLPLGVYLVYHLLPMTPYLAGLGVGISDLLQTERTRLEKISYGESVNRFVPQQAENIHSIPIFNDVWIIDKRKAYAVDNKYLYISADALKSWEKVRELKKQGEVIRFDSKGQRGWTGTIWGEIEITEDGGETWRMMDIFSVFQDIVGREFGTRSLVDDSSYLYLDPDSKRGKIVISCTLFESDDFAFTWKKSSFTNPEGKRICLESSPFAINNKKTLLIGSRTFGSSLYALRENAWVEVCALDEGSLILTSLPYCYSENVLTAEQGSFLQRYENEEAALAIDEMDYEIKNAILRNKTPETSSLKKVLRSNSDYHWMVESGAFFYKHRSAEKWKIGYHVPALVHVKPFNTTRAIGWDDANQIYSSDSSGKVWLPISLEKYNITSEYGNVLRSTHDGSGLWLLTQQGLFYLTMMDMEVHMKFKFDNGDSSTKLGISASGEVVWLYNENNTKIHFSFNRGQEWNTLDILDKEGLKDETIIIHMTCANSKKCYILLSDATIRTLVLSADTTRNSPVVTHKLPLDVYGDGYLITNQSGDSIFYFEEEGRDGYIRTSSDSDWRKISLGVKSDWSEPELFFAEDNYILRGYENASFIDAETGKVSTFNPSLWDGEISYCTEPKGQIRYAFNHLSLATSFDAGVTWRGTAEDLDRGPYCGISNDVLWLNYEGIHVYKLN